MSPPPQSMNSRSPSTAKRKPKPWRTAVSDVLRRRQRPPPRAAPPRSSPAPGCAARCSRARRGTRRAPCHALQQRAKLGHGRPVGLGRRAELHQGHDEGRVEPVRVEEGAKGAPSSPRARSTGSSRWSRRRTAPASAWRSMRASASRLASRVSGTASNTKRAPASAAEASSARRTLTPAECRFRRAGLEGAEIGHDGERRGHLAPCGRSERRRPFAVARLGVEQADLVAPRRAKQCAMPRPMRPAPTQAHHVAPGGHVRAPHARGGAAPRAPTARGRGPQGVRPVARRSRPTTAPPRARSPTATAHGSPAHVADRGEEGEPHLDVLAHVAVLPEVEGLVPVAGVDELVVRQVAVHPVRRRVVVGEREVGRSIAQPLPDRDALGVERVVDAADRGLGALVVDVPAVEVLDGSRVHQDQGWVDDGAGVHEGRGQRVLHGLDRAGEGRGDHRQGALGRRGGKDAGGQPRRARRHPRPRPVRACARARAACPSPRSRPSASQP